MFCLYTWINLVTYVQIIYDCTILLYISTLFDTKIRFCKEKNREKYPKKNSNTYPNHDK